MWKFMTRTLAATLLATAAVAGTFIVGMRRKSRVVRRAVRRISKATRGLTVASAGSSGAYASVIKHHGRSTGRAYETPVRAAATDDGFVITLPYGADTDWVRNVAATGSATLVHEGAEYEVNEPRIVRAPEAAQFFAGKDQRTQRLFGVDEYLRLHRVA